MAAGTSFRNEPVTLEELLVNTSGCCFDVEMLLALAEDLIAKIDQEDEPPDCKAHLMALLSVLRDLMGEVHDRLSRGARAETLRVISGRPHRSAF